MASCSGGEVLDLVHQDVGPGRLVAAFLELFQPEFQQVGEIQKIPVAFLPGETDGRLALLAVRRGTQRLPGQGQLAPGRPQLRAGEHRVGLGEQPPGRVLGEQDRFLAAGVGPDRKRQGVQGVGPGRRSVAGEAGQAVPQLPGRPAGEGHGQDALRRDAFLQQVGDAGQQGVGLARARAGHHQHPLVGRVGRRVLGGVEAPGQGLDRIGPAGRFGGWVVRRVVPGGAFPGGVGLAGGGGHGQEAPDPQLTFFPPAKTPKCGRIGRRNPGRGRPGPGACG